MNDRNTPAGTVNPIMMLGALQQLIEQLQNIMMPNKKFKKLEI